MKKGRQGPPKFTKKLAGRIANSREKYAFRGDLEEEYFEIADNEGKRKADNWYRGEVLRSMPSAIGSSLFWTAALMKNYFIVSLRNFRRNIGYSFINVLGLSTAMACVFLIMIWISYELKSDTFHEDHERIFYVFQDIHLENGIRSTEVTEAPLIFDLQERYPEIEQVVRYESVENLILTYEDKAFFENGSLLASPDFFGMLTYSFIHGSPGVADLQPGTIVLTESVSEKYFGGENPLGETILVNRKFPFVVSAVVEDAPDNSFVEFDFVLPFEFMKDLGYDIETYNNVSYFSLVKISEGTDAQQLSDTIRNSFDKVSEETGMKRDNYLVPIKDVTFRANAGINYVLLMALTVTAGIVLIIACINYLNLATARVMTRVREVGLRKVTGAARSQLIIQFLGESLSLSFISFVIALLMASLAMPYFNNLTNRNFSVFTLNPDTLLFYGGVLFVTGICAGLYPAVILSSFSPVKMFNRGLKSGKFRARLRKTLVVLQFAVSILVIIVTYVSVVQFNHMGTTNLGFDDKNVLHFRGTMMENFGLLREKLLSHPEIISVTSADMLPMIVSSFTPEWGVEKDKQNVLAGQSTVSFDYLSTFNIPVLEGREFDENRKSDLENTVVINRSMAENLGFDNSANKQFYINGTLYTIAGVFQDFYFFPLSDYATGPMYLRLSPKETENIFVRFNPAMRTDASEIVKQVVEELYPGFPTDISFLEDYQMDEASIIDTINTIMIYLTVFGVLIASTGLYGLAVYTCENRTKEIAVRKVLGAPVAVIVTLLSKEYSRLIIIAMTLAMPLAYFIADNMLRFFAYRIELSSTYFIFTGLFVFVIALVSVSVQAFKTARIDPVKTLKVE